MYELIGIISVNLPLPWRIDLPSCGKVFSRNYQHYWCFFCI